MHRLARGERGKGAKGIETGRGEETLTYGGLVVDGGYVTWRKIERAGQLDACRPTGLGDKNPQRINIWIYQLLDTGLGLSSGYIHELIRQKGVALRLACNHIGFARLASHYNQRI